MLLQPLSFKNVAPFWREDGMHCGWTYLLGGQGPCGRLHPEYSPDGRFHAHYYPEFFKCEVHFEDWAWQHHGKCPLSSEFLLPFVRKWMQLTRQRQGASLVKCNHWICICCGVGTGKNYKALMEMLPGLDFVRNIKPQDDHGAIFVQLAPYLDPLAYDAPFRPAESLEALLSAHQVGSYGSLP